MKEDKKQLFISAIIFVCTIIVFGISITSAYYIISENDFKTQKVVDVATKCIDIVYDEESSESIELNNQYPVSDEYALENTKPIIVAVRNKCEFNIENIEYALAITSLSTDDAEKNYIEDNKMRIQVSKEINGNTAKIIKPADYLTSLATTNNNILDYDADIQDKIKDYGNRTTYLIDEDSIASNSVNLYKIYLWLDYYEGGENNSTEGKNFMASVSLMVNPEGIIEKKYQEIEYIQSTGNQYINTGFEPDDDTTRVVFEFENTTPEEEYKEGGLRFWYTDSDNELYGIRATNANRICPVTLLSDTEDLECADVDTSKKQVYEWGVQGLKINGTVVKERAPSYIGGSLKLLSENYAAWGNIYSVKIYDNDILVRDFVPVYRTEDGTYGLLDKINKKFYGSDGTEPFTGPTVE